jgi:hypothetical protein
MERRAKTAHEMILIHGFAKVTDDPIPQSAGPDVVIGVGGYEDRRNRMPQFDEASMELQSVHRGHMKVSDQAGGFAKARGSEKIGSRCESLDSVAE